MKNAAIEIRWIALISLVILAFLLPIATGWWGIFIDDEAQDNYPNQLFKARWLQEGVIPYWNPETYAGANPFYTLQEGYLFYPVSWVFGRWGSILPSFRSYRELVIFPILLHFIWAAAGGFALGRGGLSLSRAGAAVLAIAFALSSSMITGMLMHPMTLSLSWFPWYLAVTALYARRPGPLRLVAGALVFALGGTIFPNYTVFGFVASAFLGIALLVRRGLKNGFWSAARLAVGLLAMPLLGILLAAPFWLASIEAARYLAETFTIDYEFLTAGPRSLPWRWLATIFVPELFGSTNFAFGWGVVEDHQMFWNEGVLTRGMLLWFPAAVALVLACTRYSNRGERENCRRSSADDPATLRFWTFVSAGLLFFSLLMMVGRFSPFFRIMYILGPVFRVPYATRWHTVFALGFSVLAGIGAHHLWRPRGKNGPPIGRLAGIYLALAAATVAAAVILPPGYLNKLTEPGWFLRVPGLFMLFSSALLVAAVLWGKEKRGRLLVVLAVACLFRSAAWDAYRPMGVVWAPEQDPARGPEDRELYRFMEYARGFQTDPMIRTGFSRVFADNTALVHGGLSLLGVGNKPIIPRMFSVLELTCEGMPNEVRLRDPTLALVRNLSTGRWWYDAEVPPSPEWEYIVSSPAEGLHLFKIPGALPRLFTLDRLHPADPDDQRHDLIHRDLREVVVVEADDARLRRYLDGRSGPVDSGGIQDHFALLQRENRIVRADFSNPNRIEVEIEVKIPSMLVLTDAWHPDWRAEVNGLPAPIHRVNYLQRGVWLEEGTHYVKMTFLPRSVKTGRLLSVLGVLLSAVILRRGRKKKHG